MLKESKAEGNKQEEHSSEDIETEAKVPIDSSTKVKPKRRFRIQDHFSLRSGVSEKDDGTFVINGLRHQLIFSAEDSDTKARTNKQRSSLEESEKKLGLPSPLEKSGSGNTEESKNHQTESDKICPFESTDSQDKQHELKSPHEDEILVLKVERAKTYGFGVIFLKFMYTYASFVLCGFFAVLCIYLVLQYAMGVVLAGILKPNTFDQTMGILSILSLPVLILTLSYLLTLCVSFLRDGWEGFEFLHAIAFIRSKQEWIIPVLVVCIPSLSLAMSLFLGNPSPWRIALLVSILAVTCLFLFYVLVVVCLELYTCFLICRDPNTSVVSTIRRILEKRLLQIFSIHHPKFKREDKIQNKCISTQCCETSFKKLNCSSGDSGMSQCCWEPLERGKDESKTLANEHSSQDLWKFDDFGVVTPYLNHDSSKTLYLCCRKEKDTIRGTISDFDKYAVYSCLLIGLILVYLVMIAYLSWLKFFEATTVTALAILLLLLISACGFCWISSLSRSMVTESKQDREIADGRTARFEIVYKMKPGIVAFILVLILLIFYVIPVIAFTRVNAIPFLVIYTVLFLVSGIRYIFSVRKLLEIEGPDAFEILQGEFQQTTRSENNNIRQIYLLLTRIVKQSTVYAWVTFLTIFSVGFVLLAIGGLDTESSTYTGAELLGNASSLSRIVHPFPRNGFQYPSCLPELKGNVSFLPDVPSLLDFAFLSDLTYANSESVQERLDQWFGPGNAVFLPLYESFQPNSSTTVLRHIYLNESQLDIVAVRGTVDSIDLLIDAQLWVGALGLQILRALTPLGQLWNPTQNSIDYLNDVRTYLQAVKDSGSDRVIVTGHSLGGGVSMIAGSSLRIPSVSFSGPNAKISYLKNGLSSDILLDNYTINVIPRNDIIPQVDDPALVVENINCRASSQEGVVTCHRILRTACEIMYTCGSFPRPPFKDCKNFSLSYGEPELLYNNSQ